MFTRLIIFWTCFVRLFHKIKTATVHCNKSFYYKTDNIILGRSAYLNCKFYIMNNVNVTFTKDVTMIRCAIYLEGKKASSEEILNPRLDFDAIRIDLEEHHIDDEKERLEFVMRKCCE